MKEKDTVDNPKMNGFQRMNCKRCQRIFTTHFWPQFMSGKCPQCTGVTLDTYEKKRKYEAEK